jgi:outer membrane protein assembly factor BamB
MKKCFGWLMIAGALASSVFSEDWPQYRGKNHNGTTAEKIALWPASGPRQIWKAPTTDGFSSFVVSSGKAVTQIGRSIEGVNREVCVALDADTGKELWAVPIGVVRYGHTGGMTGAPNNDGGDGPRSTPALDASNVFVMSSDLVLHCLELNTGKIVWKKDLIREHKGRNISWKNAASPVLEGDLLFVAGGGEGEALLGIRKRDGTIAWKGQDDLMTHATPVLATIGGTRQIIFFTQKGLVSLAPESGSVLWRHPFPFNVSTAASPVVGGDIVYCSAGYGIGAGAVKILKSGDRWEVAELWRKPNELINHWSTPVFKAGHLYGMFSFKEYGTGALKCVKLETGEEMWEQEGFGPGNVILAGERLLVLGDAGQLLLVEAEPKAYRELARTQAVTGKCWSTPAVSEGRIYIRSTREGVCLDGSEKLTTN